LNQIIYLFNINIFLPSELSKIIFIILKIYVAHLVLTALDMLFHLTLTTVLKAKYFY
jgi:hypothetical protein